VSRATGSADGKARLWDINDLREPSVLTGHDKLYSVAFSPTDGRLLATGSVDRTARLWDTDVERVAGHICEVAYPRITREERSQHFPDLPYRPPC
jgi:WD40 repeat protein